MFEPMSGGILELEELTEAADQNTPLKLGKKVRKSPSLFKLAGTAAIPLSAALGFVAAPSRRFAVHTAGALVTGIAGAVGKSRLDAMTAQSVKPAIAQALIDNGLDNPDATAAAVQSIQESFGMEEEDFAELCTEIYTAYLLGMVKYNPAAKTGELKELENVKKALLMENLAVGQAHAVAAMEWYRSTSTFTPEEELEDPENPQYQAANKLLFLTERALRQGGETEQAFLFEMTRTAKALKLSYSEAMERVQGTSDPFYQRALRSTRSKLGSDQVSSAMLERARTTLGINEASAFDMHVACFNEEVRDQLGLPPKDEIDSEDAITPDDEPVNTFKTKFADGALEKLEQLRDILGLSETDAFYEIVQETTPLYQETALAAMNDVLAKTKTPDQAWEAMDTRREELLLSKDNSKDLVSSMVMQALGRPLEETNKFAVVNNDAATYDHLLEALEAKETLISILKKSGWSDFEDKFDETFCNPFDKQSANGFLLSDERVKMYSIFLNRSIRKATDGVLSDEQYQRIGEVKGLLGISDEQAEMISRKVFGPELQKVLQTATDEIVEDYTDALVRNMQGQVDAAMTNYRLSEGFLQEVGAGFYAKAVELVSSMSPGGIPTPDLSKALEALREMFKLSKEDTFPSHNEYFGSVYKKSVLEAMGTTGVIRKEFRGPLEDLRQRLGVSEESCKELFLEAVAEKMKPMAEWIGSEMERTMLSQQQLAKRRGKDMGEDMFQTGKGADGVLGLGAEANIMSDIMELVDFYNENDIVEEAETTIPPTAEGEEEKVVMEKVYPVTALGVEAIDQEVAELLYRQVVVSALQAQGEQGARYEAARDTFGGILGLDKDKMADTQDNIGSLVYDNVVSNAMKTKGSMDQQDMMTLANIQGKLGLTSEQGEKLMIQSQKKILSEEIEALMDDPTPESVKAFREKCNMMGMDMQEDVGVSKNRLGRMFDVEIVPGLKSGETTPENSDILAEVQESLGLEAEECESMFENALIRMSKQAMDMVQSELLRGREDNTVPLIKELVQYAAFTGGDLGLEVEEAIGNQVINIYDAFDFTGIDADQVETNKELLRAAVGR